MGGDDRAEQWAEHWSSLEDGVGVFGRLEHKKKNNHTQFIVERLW